MDTLGRRPALLGWSVAILFAIVLFAVINASNTPPTPVAELVAEKDKPPIEKPSRAGRRPSVSINDARG